jgi:hypothetical protein
MSTITLRSVKGSGLTNNEIDTNFTNLNTDKIEATQTVTLTNKTLALGGNTISGTTAQFNTALTDGDFSTLAGTETLTNKTLTSPAINGGVIDTTSTTATAALGTSSTRLANTAFVQQEKEYLPALSQSLHIGAIVKAIVYDTSADSDGGAWRKRCADKSWYTEALGGDRWIGQYATISAAWTAAGSATGAVYQASATAGAQTIGLYYTPTSSTTVTQVYRGVSRGFPAVAGIVVETTRVIVYDLSAAGCPMWMVFNASAATYPLMKMLGRSTVAKTGVACANGLLLISSGSTGVESLIAISFIKDNAINYSTTSYSGNIPSTISARDSLVTWGPSTSIPVIVNSTVNDVAITVLDTAPIDPATGLPVPTIAVATAGGVSVIKDDGTVVNSATAANMVSVAFDSEQRIAFNTGGYVGRTKKVGSLAASFVNNDGPLLYNSNAYSPKASNNYLASPLGTAALTLNVGRAAAGSTGVAVLKLGDKSEQSMAAAITTAYNSGHMVGDIRGAYLADSTAETVTASGELVTNGTFDTDTSGWTAQAGATLSVVSGALRVTNGTATYGIAYQSVPTVIGKTYQISCSAVGGTGSFHMYVGVGAGGNTLLDTTAAGVFTFTASTTTSYISLFANSSTLGVYYEFDNISVKLAEPDRCVKNKGLVINGSLTKTAVASGAGLVAYSGFSAANYLEQPYSADLDFGTGDFSILVDYSITSAATGTIFARGVPTIAGSLMVNSTSAGAAVIYIAGASSWVTNYCTFTIPVTTGFHLLDIKRTSGVITVTADGVSCPVTVGAGSLATSVTLGSSATLRVGERQDTSQPWTGGSLALLRLSATAPSADQIAHIYRTELPLFQASAQCTLAGSSTAVTALAYDDTSDILHVGTSWGRSGFRDLLRIDSEATTNGAITSLSAKQGAVLTGGATAGSFYLPAMLLRDELRRKDEARKALGKVPVFFDYTATASQTAFVAPKGYAIKAVYHNGTLKRETTTGVYWTRSTDGFAETCTLSAGATVSDWISLMCVRT